MNHLMNHENFSQYLNEAFTLHTGNSELQLKLIAVDELSSDQHYEEERKPFALLFHAQSDPGLPQQMYSLKQEKMGSLDMFLVPVGPDRKMGGMRFEAIFN